MRAYALTGAAVLLALLAIAVIRGWLLRPAATPTAQPLPAYGVDADQIAEHLAGAIRFKTVSHSDAAVVAEAEFAGLHAYLEQTYPAAHAHLRRELVGGYSLLYTWPGQDPDAPPILLLGHQDVVPAEEVDAWTYPPFDGVVRDGFVWGRGAVDNKHHVIVLLEAVEALLRVGFTPQSTVYLAFGHDEEVGGHHGAQAIAELLDERGIRPGIVIDEGGGSTGLLNVLPWFGDRPLTLIGVAEKGAANVKLVARYAGPAHSSVPPRNTPVGRLATAIHRLEAGQCPAHITEAVAGGLRSVGPDLPLLGRILVANRPLTDPLLRAIFLAKPETAALVRTTTAATMMRGSTKENIIPHEAEAVVNYRILPGVSVEGVLHHVRSTIQDDAIEVTHYRSRNPSPVSRMDSAGYALLTRTIHEAYPNAIVGPWLVLGGTDARHYYRLTDSVYRFTPGIFTMADLKGAHGVDERLSIENLAFGVRFFMRLLENAEVMREPSEAQRTASTGVTASGRSESRMPG